MTELEETAKNVAALLVQHDRRILVLEQDSKTFKSAVKYLGYSLVTLLAGLLASNLFHL